MHMKKKYWNMSCVAAVVLSLVTFTPLVIPQGVSKPMLGGIPYSLWTSFIITVALVVLTFIGTRVHPGMEEEEEDKS